jgi:hypothetical protein
METWRSPMDWAQAQFGCCRLRDKRRTARLVVVGCSMLARSSASIPKQMQSLANVKGAYRLFGMDEVTHEAICAPHWGSTRELARLPGQGLVLFIQDQTELNYGPKPDSYGLGFTSDTTGRGIEIQTTLCLVPDSAGLERPEVLGIALQSPWLRTHAPRKQIETSKEAKNRRTEYDTWEESVAEIGPAPSPESGTTWVSVGDRASDVFSHLFTATELGWVCLIRSRHDRKLYGTGDSAKLHQTARSLEPMGSTSISLRSRPASVFLSDYQGRRQNLTRSELHQGLGGKDELVDGRAHRMALAYHAAGELALRGSAGGSALPASLADRGISQVPQDRLQDGKPQPEPRKQAACAARGLEHRRRVPTSAQDSQSARQTTRGVRATP